LQKFFTYDLKDTDTFKVLVAAKYAKVEVTAVEGTEQDAKASPDGTVRPFLLLTIILAPLSCCWKHRCFWCSCCCTIWYLCCEKLMI
jgi:hypothetical protein